MLQCHLQDVYGWAVVRKACIAGAALNDLSLTTTMEVLACDYCFLSGYAGKTQTASCKRQLEHQSKAAQPTLRMVALASCRALAGRPPC